MGKSKKKHDTMNVMAISYLANENIVHSWYLLVYILENYFGAVAIPRYEAQVLSPGVYTKEVETDAPIEDMQAAARLLIAMKYSGKFPELVNVFIR